MCLPLSLRSTAKIVVYFVFIRFRSVTLREEHFRSDSARGRAAKGLKVYISVCVRFFVCLVIPPNKQTRDR